MKKLFMFLALGALVFTLAACRDEDPENGENGENGNDVEYGTPVFQGVDDKYHAQGHDFDPLEGVYAVDEVDGDLRDEIDVDGSVDVDEIGEYELTYTVTNGGGETATATRTISVRAAAEGEFNFKYADEELRNTFFGAAERYLLQTQKGGVPLFSNSGYVMYSERLDLLVDEPVPVLNWAVTFAEMTDDDEGLQIEAGETGEEGNFTYRRAIQNNPDTMHQWTYSDADSADAITLFQDSLYYFGLNEDQDNWEMQLGLADGFPEAQDAEVNEFGREVARTYHIPIKEGLEWGYHEDTDTSDFPEGHEVINAHSFEETYKKAMEEGWFRATGGGGNFDNPNQRIKNAAEYMAWHAWLRDEDQEGEAPEEVEWEDVGIEAIDDHTLELEFEVDMAEWNVQYWLSSFVVTPINLHVYDWAEEDGGAYGTAPEYVAAHGPYILTYWEDDVVLRFEENPNFHDEDRHYFTGHRIRIIDGAEIRFQMFLDGELDAVAIPGESYEDHADDPRVHFIPGATTFRLMINGLQTVEAQEEAFPASDYTPEPILGYDSFKRAMYHAINREELAYDAMVTATPQMYHFSEAYVVDPAGSGVAFRNTDFGPLVGQGLSPDTHAYNPDAARAFFGNALDKAVAEGFYEEGDTIELDLFIFSGSQNQVSMANFIKDAFEENFVNEKYDINVIVNFEAKDFPGIYFDYMMTGQFDLSIGGISGSTLDAASFLDVYSSDNRGGFTLNWGIDTSQPDIFVEYEVGGEQRAEMWSFDAIYEALSGPVYLEGGREATPPEEE